MTDAAIQARELSRRFGAFTAVDRVTFDVAPGEVFGYLGANGAGKSTTMRMLCGLLRPTSGTALVAGHDVGRESLEVRRSIGYMSQKFSLYLDLTVEENLAFFAGAYGLSGRRKAERLPESLRLGGLADRGGTLARDLPGGARQRLALASALLHEPPVLFLDEPTAGVDPAARRAFWRVIRELARAGTTLFVTTHHIEDAELCDRVGMMAEGRLVALDTPSALKRRFVPETLFSVSVAGGAPAIERALGRADGFRGAHQFGTAAHVRVTGSLSRPEDLRAALTQQGVQVQEIELAEASLEDVFLAIAGGGA